MGYPRLFENLGTLAFFSSSLSMAKRMLESECPTPVGIPRPTTVLGAEIKQSRDALDLLRMALDRLWVVRDANTHSSDVKRHCSVSTQQNLKVIELAGAAYQELENLVEVLELTQVAIADK